MTDPSPAPLAFVDVETDGIHPGRKAWEVAVIRREPDGTESTFECFVDIDLSTADPFGLRVGRFYDRHPVGRVLAGRDRYVASALEQSYSVAHDVARMTHGAHLVGAVPNFDAETFDHLLRGEGLIPAWHHHLVDVEALAVGYLAGQGRPVTPPWRSDELTAALALDPVPNEERHTAMGDARWAQRIYDHIQRADVAPSRDSSRT